MSGFELLFRRRRDYDKVKDPGMPKVKRKRVVKAKSKPLPATEAPAYTVFGGGGTVAAIGNWTTIVPSTTLATIVPSTTTGTLATIVPSTTTGTATFTLTPNMTLTQPTNLSTGDAIQYRYVLTTTDVTT